MNIFATEQGILGATDYARQHNTFHAFLTLARSIRKRLGARAYMLDEYIRQLLILAEKQLEYRAKSRLFQRQLPSEKCFLKTADS